MESRKNNKKYKTESTFKLNNIIAKTPRQKLFFQNCKKFEVISLTGYAGTGKAQPLDCKILTPLGWKLMGDIKIDDKIIDKDGNICRVVNTFPQGKTECYKLTFSDGSSTRAHGEHLWYGYISRYGSKKHDVEVLTTNELLKIFNNYKNPKFSIPLLTPHKGVDINLPLDPYILGFLIGDGCFKNTPTFATSDEEIVLKLREEMKKFDLSINKSKGDKYSYYITTGRKGPKRKNKLTSILKDLNLYNKLSYDKFIPEIYKQASYSQKLKLINGLLDSDGTIGKSGCVSFSTTSLKLAEDFRDLIRSIGGKSAISVIKTKSSFGKSFTVSVSVLNKKDLFSLSRKKERIPENIDIKQYRRKLLSIEKIDDCETQCISVDSLTHTYITDDYIVTHNTFISLYQALKLVEDGEYNEVLVLRSAVPSRDIGFMPGNKKEKMNVYENPYVSICSKLYGRGDAYSILKQKGLLKFDATSFLRGETFENTVIVFDEVQNANYTEIYTILTRLGENCKVFLCGDTRQDDLTSERFKEKSGYDAILNKLELIPSCFKINFEIDDIQRSKFVKEFIIATSI